VRLGRRSKYGSVWDICWTGSELANCAKRGCSKCWSKSPTPNRAVCRLPSREDRRRPASPGMPRRYCTAWAIKLLATQRQFILRRTSASATSVSPISPSKHLLLPPNALELDACIRAQITPTTLPRDGQGRPSHALVETVAARARNKIRFVTVFARRYCGCQRNK